MAFRHGRLSVSSTLPVRDAVIKGRSRAAPFNKAVSGGPQPPPGALIYMDFAGPLIQSVLYKYSCYCGTVDAGSGYGRVWPDRLMTAPVASSAIAKFIADVASTMGFIEQYKPAVVRSDKGSAFVSYHFREFLADRQVHLTYSAEYTPQQNSHIERFWGITFGTARVLLAAANLPPTFLNGAILTTRPYSAISAYGAIWPSGQYSAIQEGWRQIGGGEKNSRGAKGDAPKPFDMRILLRRVLSRVRQVYLAIGKKLAEVIRDESTSFVRPHDCRLVLLNETHLGRNIGDELRNGRRSDGSSHKAVRPNTSVPAACVDSAAVTTVLIEHTLDKWSSKIHVDERTRGRLWTTRDCFIERSSSRPSLNNCVSHRESRRDSRPWRNAMSSHAIGHETPLLGIWESETVEYNGLGRGGRRWQTWNAGDSGRDRTRIGRKCNDASRVSCKCDDGTRVGCKSDDRHAVLGRVHIPWPGCSTWHEDNGDVERSGIVRDGNGGLRSRYSDTTTVEIMGEAIQVTHDTRRVEHGGAVFEDDNVGYLEAFPLISNE